MPLRTLREQIVAKARVRSEYDRLSKTTAVTDESSPFHGDVLALALHRYVYVLCHKCQKPYYGGEAQCQQVCLRFDTT